MSRYKHIVVFCLLILYAYDFAGYLAVFLIRQHAIKSEMEEKREAAEAGEKRVVLAFHTPSLLKGQCSIQWLEDDEFRFQGRMYDVISKSTKNDSTYFICLNDTKEERLNENLAGQVQSRTDSPRKQAASLATKDPFSESNINASGYLSPLIFVNLLACISQREFESVILDIDSPPPENS